jgi:hypothetical protein
MNAAQPTLAIVPWYRQRWPWILMSGPAIVLVAGVITTWIAFESADGLVADDYYRKGLAINKVIAREEKARSLGLTADIDSRGGRLRVHLAGDAPEAIFAHLVHATRSGFDARLRLARGADGSYEAALPVLPPGRWRLALENPRGSWRILKEGL